jgi:outer membrane protein assembly factor BamB
LKAPKALARWQLLALLIIMAFVLVGCGSSRHGVSWPSLDLVTIDEQQLVLVTYNATVVLIDPYNSGSRYSIGQNADGSPINWEINGANYLNNQFYASPFLSSENERTTLVFPTYSNDAPRLLEFYLDTAQTVNAAGYPLADGVVADVVQGDGLLYVAYRKGGLVALDDETYTQVWRLDTASGVWASPLLNEGVLYVTSVDHNLYAVDAATGEIRWQKDLEGGIAASPILYDGFLYVGSFAHKLFKISLDGEIVASFEGNNWPFSSAVAADGVIYYSDLGGYVYALNADDLSLIWSARPAERGIRPAPVLVGDYLIVASRDGRLYRLNRETGAINTATDIAEFKDRAEVLSDLLYIPADEATNRPAILLAASTDPGKLVTAFNLDNFTTALWTYPH